ncbi:hypothetical protein Micbo1qcDRAFT_193853 [Microdochium bolleyi]|uniref:EF-hand domain-containing protein n=1 Tax=Microdochium bolleyi TaxID=196109 RepID=A0A136JC72_9PEZI|nr:hypothetical protein Micbo1qcDRAFT_193853 [Microdochium bolleyi]
MSSAASGYKPSPLGYGSPSARNSPFRRPESPGSPSPVTNSPFRNANVTPTTSPTKQQSNASFAHSRLGSTASASAASPPPLSPGLDGSNRTPRFGGSSSGNNNNSNSNSMPSHTSSHLGSPAMISRTTAAPAAPPANSTSVNGNALSQLQASQVRTLRDGFQILDRNSDGVVTREDVADMLDQLVFMNSIASTLAAMSPSTELLSAFSAFDDDDSGQIDLAELRDALLTTAPEPGERSLTASEVDRIVSGYSGRRAFSKSSVMAAARDHHGGGGGGGGGGFGGGAKKGEVFKYHEFVQSIVGGGRDNSETSSSRDDGSED